MSGKCHESIPGVAAHETLSYKLSLPYTTPPWLPQTAYRASLSQVSSSYCPVRLRLAHLPVLQLLSKERGVYGLRNGDYERYR